MAVKGRYKPSLLLTICLERMSEKVEPICPLCNQLTSATVVCNYCGNQLTDQGKISDYFDSYSPYEEINATKLVASSQPLQQTGECLHIFTCPSCYQYKELAIKETTLYV